MTAPHRILLIAPDVPVYLIGAIEDGQILGRVGDELIGVDAPPPGAHATDHQNGGADEISVAGLSGVLADPQPPIIGGGAGDAVAGNDARLTDARTPTAHAHPISDVTSLQTALDGKSATGHNHDAAYSALGHSHAVPKLDDLAAPDDNTDLNASLTAHGLLQKLPGGTTTYLRADGGWGAPAAALPPLIVTAQSTAGADRTIAAGYSAYVPDQYEIEAAYTLEIATTGCLEIG